MRILITNDDGIKSDGLIRLAKAALEFGEVWVIAPDDQRSAASHSITLRKTFDVMPCPEFPIEGVKAFSCSGMPGDCIRVGCLGILPEKSDVVLSGINFGYNCATDIQYSATCGAAFEADFQGIKGIALSEEACEETGTTDMFLHQILKECFETPSERGEIINVNFPGVPGNECKGILRNRTVSHSMFFKDHYDIEVLEDKTMRCIVHGTPNLECEDGTDMKAVIDGYISIGVVKNIGY